MIKYTIKCILKNKLYKTITITHLVFNHFSNHLFLFSYYKRLKNLSNITRIRINKLFTLFKQKSML